MNYNIYDQEVENINLRTNRIINTINPHSYCMAKKDSHFQNVLKNSDILLPDGIGIVMASKVLKGKKIKRITGYDLFIFIMNNLNQIGGSCFFMGSSNKTLKLIEDRVKKDFKNVEVHSYSPPFKKVFSEEDNGLIINEVNKYKPTVLFVGMTAPKQEKWAYDHKDKLNVETICSIGAVFDFYAGTIKRSNPFWIKMGLEWLPRFLREPKRLAERNLVSTPKFILEVLSFKLRGVGL